MGTRSWTVGDRGTRADMSGAPSRAIRLSVEMAPGRRSERVLPRGRRLLRSRPAAEKPGSLIHRSLLYDRPDQERIRKLFCRLPENILTRCRGHNQEVVAELLMSCSCVALSNRFPSRESARLGLSQGQISLNDLIKLLSGNSADQPDAPKLHVVPEFLLHIR